MKKKAKKKSAKRELVVLVRWKGKKPNVRFCDGWATLSLNGWSAGLHLDRDSLVREDEVQDAIDNFLDIDSFEKTSEASWEFRVVVPLR